MSTDTKTDSVAEDTSAPCDPQVTLSELSELFGEGAVLPARAIEILADFGFIPSRARRELTALSDSLRLDREATPREHEIVQNLLNPYFQHPGNSPLAHAMKPKIIRALTAYRLELEQQATR